MSHADEMPICACSGGVAPRPGDMVARCANCGGARAPLVESAAECPWCDEIDAEAEGAAARAEAVEQLAAKARSGDDVAIAAVRDLLTMSTLPEGERMALEAAL